MTGILDNALAHATAWALVSSLWQNFAIGAVAWGVLRCLARATSRTRYLVAWCCMAAMLAVPVATGVRAYGSYVHAAADATVVAAPATASPAPTAPTRSVSLRHAPPAASEPLPLLKRVFVARAGMPTWLRNLVLLLWLTGVSVHLLRIGVGLRGTYRLTVTDLMATPAWLERLVAATSQSVGVRLCVVRVSARATMPLVIGMVRPVILMPASFVTGLPPEALRALIAHELAHVRRHDFLFNLLQVIAESLVFYHPAAWWLTRVVRAERERCCDDIAAAVVRDRRAVACALVVAEELRSASRPAYALAATDGSLSDRVRRLLRPPIATRDRGAAAIALVALASALLVVPATALHGSRAAAADEWQQIWSGDIADGAWLRVYNLNGPVVVERGAVEHGTVLARSEGADVVITSAATQDSDVLVCVMQPQLGECNSDGLIWRGSQTELALSVTQLRVIVPHDYAVEAAAHVGDLTLRGGTASIVARTGAGAIHVAADAASVEAASGRGRIEIAGGLDVVARSSDGDVELTEVRGDARVRTTNGAVVARLAAGRPARTLEIGTGTGSVLVLLPSNIRATLSARAGDGRVRLAYPAATGAASQPAERLALIGGGGRAMNIVTGRGDITVLPR